MSIATKLVKNSCQTCPEPTHATLLQCLQDYEPQLGGLGQRSTWNEWCYTSIPLVESTLPRKPTSEAMAFLAVEEQLWGDGRVALILCMVHKEVPKLIWYIEPTLYNIHGEAILDFFTPDGYNNVVEVEWDEEECHVIPEGEHMARESTNTNEHDWLINQNLDELL